jgi:plastocyanin
MMSKVDMTYLTTFAFFLTIVVTFYSCGSSHNTTDTTVSSASAQIVTCPGTTAADVSITTAPAFVPNSVSVAVNGVVKWTNNDSTIHTATSGTPGALDGKFDTGNMAPNAAMCVQFLAAGSYNYFCNIHTFMRGTVTVQ